MRAVADGLAVSTVFGPTEPHSVVVTEGDWLTVSGGAGAGKSAFGLALCGVESDRVQAGSVTFADGAPPPTAYVPTRPDLMFSGLASSVLREVGLFVPNELNHLDEASRCLELFGVLHLSERDPLSLSGGERAKVALAAAAAQHPQFMLLDQVIDWIDVASRERVFSALEALGTRGLSLIETVTDRRVAARTAGPVVRLRDLRGPLDSSRYAQEYPRRPCSLRACLARAGYGSGGFGLGPFDFAVDSGESVAVVGPNGAGKTTLLRGLALLLPDQAGSILIETAGPRPQKFSSAQMRRREHEWATACLYCFQEPDDQLFCTTVREELEFTPRVSGAPCAIDIDRLAGRFGLDRLLDRSPLALPRGMRRAVLLASCFAANPPVLLLDEPTAELGRREYEALVLELKNYSSAGGISLLVSHDEEFVQRVTHRRIHVRDGRVEV